MNEVNNAIRNIRATMHIQELHGNPDAAFILKHMPRPVKKSDKFDAMVKEAINA